MDNTDLRLVIRNGILAQVRDQCQKFMIRNNPRPESKVTLHDRDKALAAIVALCDCCNSVRGGVTADTLKLMIEGLDEILGQYPSSSVISAVLGAHIAGLRRTLRSIHAA